MNKNIIIMAILVVVFGAGGFFGGMKYQENKRTVNFRQFNGNVQGLRAGDGDRQAFRPVNGEIIGSDEKSITVKLEDGSSKIVLLAESTQFLKSLSGSKEDLKVGDKVMVVGSDNTDGSVTAQNIQINPPARRTPESSGQ
jgi:hypothetical protein